MFRERNSKCLEIILMIIVGSGVKLEEINITLSREDITGLMNGWTIRQTFEDKDLRVYVGLRKEDGGIL